MNNKIKWFGAAALITMIGLFYGCDLLTRNGDEEKLETKNLTIAGTFASQNDGNEDAKFSATTNNAEGRSITATSFALEGLLEDGDITFRLHGSYNSETGTYTLSAASSILRYTITGSFNTAGIAESGSAVVQIKSADGWITTELEVSVTGTAPVIDGSGEIVDDTAGGIPVQMRGIWRDAVNADFYALVNAFSVVVYEKTGNDWAETDTMFFTDIETGSGITSGITAFMDWDFDAIYDENKEWYQQMVKAYTDIKYPGKTIAKAIEIRSSYIAAQMALPDANNQILQMLSGGIHMDAASSPWRDNRWDFGYEVRDESSWMMIMDALSPFKDEETGMWLCDCEWETGGQAEEAHKIHLEEILDNPALAEFQNYIVILYLDEWYFSVPEDTPQAFERYHAFLEAVDVIAVAWAASNNIIVVDQSVLQQEMQAVNHQEKWLKDNYPAYRAQFYSKMSLRLHNGKLIPGNYYKSVPANGNIIPYDVYHVRNYSDVNSLNNHKEWGEGLGR